MKKWPKNLVPCPIHGMESIYIEARVTYWPTRKMTLASSHEGFKVGCHECDIKVGDWRASNFAVHSWNSLMRDYSKLSKVIDGDPTKKKRNAAFLKKLAPGE